MSNMSYCRYHNTLLDLRDCQEAMEEEADTNPDTEKLSDEEARAKRQLIALCQNIAENYGEDG